MSQHFISILKAQELEPLHLPTSTVTLVQDFTVGEVSLSKGCGNVWLWLREAV